MEDAAFVPGAGDLAFEEELLREPYALGGWLRYLAHSAEAGPRRRQVLYERALRALPGSYKLWRAYLAERRAAAAGLRPGHPAHESVNNTFERALVNMHKMPRIWMEYLEVLVAQRQVTKARRTFDRALCSLPITQHDRIWPQYLDMVRQADVPVETGCRVYRRYMQIEPQHAEEFIEYLKAKELWGEAARRLAECVNDPMFTSLAGKSKHQMWLELCDLITKHPNEVQGLDVDAILRGGIRSFTDEVSRLWTSLADYYIRRAMFEKARDVYVEGIGAVATVRDFTVIFDAYSHFEETMIAAKMEAGGEEEEEEPETTAADFLVKDGGDDLDLRLARLEALMDERPLLLNSVLLRQNPHNVGEWHKRVKLYEGQAVQQILTFTEAVKTVDPHKATGRVQTLWTAFAKFYERHGDLENARVVFRKATEAKFRTVDDLAAVWCEAAEMEIRHKHYQEALALLRTATREPDLQERMSWKESEAGAVPLQAQLYRNLKLWNFYTDLEESLGTVQSAKAVYTKILDLRIATPQIILNFAMMLQENAFWEEAFKVYERGVAAFKYPHVSVIWKAYLTHFLKRYGGKKIERTRDLFEQALLAAPADQCKDIYVLYAKLEEEHGMGKRAMDIFEKAWRTVAQGDKLAVLELYLAKASEYYGVGKVRAVYQGAIEVEPPEGLEDAGVKAMCVKFATLEKQLGEIDRARAIYIHGSNMADPRRDPGYWGSWNAFEVQHGNEETFREMLRIKRSVGAFYSQVHVGRPRAGDGAKGGAKGGAKADHMAALEAEAAAAAAEAPALPGFVSAGVIQQGQEEVAKAAEPENEEEIDLDDDEDDEDDGDGAGAGAGAGEFEPVQKAVPDAVFGGLKRKEMA